MRTRNLLATIIVLSVVVGLLSYGTGINFVSANQTAWDKSAEGNMTSGNATSTSMLGPTNMTTNMTGNMTTP
jgi:hypothetical protein